MTPSCGRVLCKFTAAKFTAGAKTSSGHALGVPTKMPMIGVYTCTFVEPSEHKCECHVNKRSTALGLQTGQKPANDVTVTSVQPPPFLIMVQRTQE
jgi:hypothetical protein